MASRVYKGAICIVRPHRPGADPIRARLVKDAGDGCWHYQGVDDPTRVGLVHESQLLMGIWHNACCLVHPQKDREPWTCPTCGCRWIWRPDLGPLDNPLPGYTGDFDHPSWDWMITRSEVA